MFTVNIYMNDDFAGGATRFFANLGGQAVFAVQPVASDTLSSKYQTRKVGFV